MLSSPLEFLLKTAGAPFLTDFFITILLIIFVCSIVWKTLNKHHAFTAYTPTLLTSMGILGTFAGIISGLLEFDPNNIDGSITVLLAGLKVAFITSLVGMALSIIYKGLASSGILSLKKHETIDHDEIDIGDLYRVMKDQANGILALKKAISENDESSLVGQVKLMRADMADHNRAQAGQLEACKNELTEIGLAVKKQDKVFQEFANTLWIQLQDFADMLSKSATEQVIEALRSVIADFNKNLIDQFGDNFQELNEAVEKLVTWQDNYKHQLADMKTQYDHSVEAIVKTEHSVAHISKEAKNIPATMEQLKHVMEVNQHQLAELARHLDAFKDIRDRAVEAVPEIRNQINETLDGVKHAADTLSTGMSDSMDKVKNVIISSAEDFENNVSKTNAALIESSNTLSNSSEGIREQMDAMLTDVNNHMRNMVEELADGSKQITEDFKASGTQLLTENNKILDGLDAAIERTLSDTGEVVLKQIRMLDDSMGQEIEQALNQMGQALSRITGQFTTDYQKLTNEMQQIVQAGTR